MYIYREREKTKPSAAGRVQPGRRPTRPRILAVTVVIVIVVVMIVVVVVVVVVKKEN